MITITISAMYNKTAQKSCCLLILRFMWMVCWVCKACQCIHSSTLTVCNSSLTLYHQIPEHTNLPVLPSSESQTNTIWDTNIPDESDFTFRQLSVDDGQSSCNKIRECQYGKPWPIRNFNLGKSLRSHYDFSHSMSYSSPRDNALFTPTYYNQSYILYFGDSLSH